MLRLIVIEKYLCNLLLITITNLKIQFNKTSCYLFYWNSKTAFPNPKKRDNTAINTNIIPIIDFSYGD
ncbi:hypothetical protein CHT99_19275 [Sphingobacterium cellulitidis]|nr:hypothetical protein CHT99_19275 [Sphingobacterium cellulitidis]